MNHFLVNSNIKQIIFARSGSSVAGINSANINHGYCRLNSQAGAVLITSLVFLVLLTIMSFTVMNNSILQFRMAGNLRDRQIAYGAADAALRNAEAYVRSSGRICGGAEVDADTTDSGACENGFCYNGATMTNNGEDWLASPVFAIDDGNDGTPLDANEKWSVALTYGNESGSTADASYYGGFAGCTFWAIDASSLFSEPDDIPLVYSQPKFLIEYFEKGGKHYYRITAMAWGTRQGTRVRLQSVFTPEVD
jgi:type IV pilus assembly protein PilX